MVDNAQTVPREKVGAAFVRIADDSMLAVDRALAVRRSSSGATRVVNCAPVIAFSPPPSAWPARIPGPRRSLVRVGAVPALPVAAVWASMLLSASMRRSCGYPRRSRRSAAALRPAPTDFNAGCSVRVRHCVAPRAIAHRRICRSGGVGRYLQQVKVIDDGFAMKRGA